MVNAFTDTAADCHNSQLFLYVRFLTCAWQVNDRKNTVIELLCNITFNSMNTIFYLKQMTDMETCCSEQVSNVQSTDFNPIPNG